jgi:hypothetical protein
VLDQALTDERAGVGVVEHRVDNGVDTGLLGGVGRDGLAQEGLGPVS